MYAGGGGGGGREEKVTCSPVHLTSLPVCVCVLRGGGGGGGNLSLGPLGGKGLGGWRWAGAFVHLWVHWGILLSRCTLSLGEDSPYVCASFVTLLCYPCLY